MRCDHNPKFKELPEIEVGDHIEVRPEGQLLVRVIAEVTEVVGDEIIATGICVYEGLTNNVMITSGYVYQKAMDKDRPLRLKALYVFAVVKP